MQLQAFHYRRFHVSYLLGAVALGILCGVGSAHLWQVTAGWFIVALLILTIAVGIYIARWWSFVAIFISSFLLGSIQGTSTLAAISEYQPYVDKITMVRGVAADDSEMTKFHTTQVEINEVTVNGRKLVGSLYVTLATRETQLRRGDGIKVSGKIAEGFGRYQATIKNGLLVSVQKHNDPLLNLRDAFSSNVRTVMTEPAASLGLGFVVGQRSSLPIELDDQLRTVGLTHIVVASGYNLTILVRLARRLFENRSKYVAFMSSMSLMVVFVLVSGMTPSMVRASLVTGLSLLAWYYGRRFHPLLLILYVAAMTAYINPIYEWYDIGWYLSFLAFAGVLIIAPLIGEGLRRATHQETLPSFVQVILETISAQVMTLPLILMIFGSLPVLALLSNALVAEVIPLAMLLTFTAGMVGFIWIPIATVVGVMASIIIDYVLAIVTVLSKPDWAQLQVQISPMIMAIIFVLIMVAAGYGYYRLKFSYRQTSLVD